LHPFFTNKIIQQKEIQREAKDGDYIYSENTPNTKIKIKP